MSLPSHLPVPSICWNFLDQSVVCFASVFSKYLLFKVFLSMYGLHLLIVIIIIF